MLDPDLVLAEVVAAIQSIPAVVTYCNDDPTLIVGHQFAAGVELSLGQSVFQMTSPSVLIAYKDLLGGGAGGFDGATLWKHRLDIWLRPGNMAPGGSGSNGPYASPQHLWWLIMNSVLPAASTLPPPSGWQVGQRLRYSTLLSGSLELMDTPTLMYRQDQEGQDLFVGSCTWPEFGDQ